MNNVSLGEIVSSYQTAVSATEAKSASKSKVNGKTIGEPKLTEKAADYYEQLKKKYSDMDFILVSKDKKEVAKAQAASYANANKMVVLIDEEKIERMAEDENYRRQYEGIIAGAASGMSQLGTQISATGATVKGYGMQVNDNGTATYFAVLEKSSAAQRERIEKKAAEKKAEKKAEQKKAEKEKQQERIEKSHKDKTSVTDEEITITASSPEELVKKIQDYMQMSMSDFVETDEEKMLGRSLDYSV